MGSSIDPVVFWSVLALLALAALASVAMFWRLRRLRRSLAAVRQWVSVDATVSETRIVEIGAGDSSAYQPVVLFRYTVGGRDYLADGLEVGPRRSFLLKRNANLLPQELVLLYLILEINQCNPNPIKE